MHCPIWPLAKQTRLPFPNSTSQTQKNFDLLHVDVWVPYKTPTHGNARYFLTIVDNLLVVSYAIQVRHLLYY